MSVLALLRRRPRLAATVALPALAALAALPLEAQRLYRLELSGAGSYNTYDSQLELGTTFGGVLRLGYWVYGPLSLAGEVSLARPRTDTSLDKAISTSVFGAGLVGNFPLGQSAHFLLKGGYAHLSIGTCPAVSVPGAGPCGSADVVQGGAGVRIALARVSPAIDDATRTHEVRAVVTAERAPSDAEGRLVWQDPAPHVPGELLVRRGAALGVFVVREGSARFVPLDGAQEGRPARTDLPADTRIAVDGRNSLVDGQPLK